MKTARQREQQRLREAYGFVQYYWLFSPWPAALLGIAFGAAIFGLGFWMGSTTVRLTCGY
jgi:hypothetical protein